MKISHSTADGQEALLAILGAGDFFGELALLDSSPRSATAEALEASETLTLHREDFRRYLNQIIPISPCMSCKQWPNISGA